MNNYDCVDSNTASRFIPIPSSNFGKRIPNGIEIDTLVLHHTVAPSLKSTVDLFLPKDSLSAHYVIGNYKTEDESQILQLVAEKYKSYHVGVSYLQGVESLNNNSIGLEIVNNGIDPFPQKQMEAVKNLCLDLIKRNPKITPDKIVGHAEVGTVAWNPAVNSYALRRVGPSVELDWEYLASHGVGLHIGNNYNEIDVENVLFKHGDTSNSISLLKKRMENFGYKMFSDKQREDNSISNNEYDDVFMWIVYAFAMHHLPKKLRQKLPKKTEKEDLFKVDEFNSLKTKLSIYCQQNNLINKQINDQLSPKNTFLEEYYNSTDRYTLPFAQFKNIILDSAQAFFPIQDYQNIRSMVEEFEFNWNHYFTTAWHKSFLPSLRKNIVWTKLHDNILSYHEKESEKYRKSSSLSVNTV